MPRPLRRQFAFGFLGMMVVALLVWLLPGAAPMVAQDSLAAAPTTPVAPAAVPLGTRLIGLLGIAVILGVAYAMSNDRKAIRWRTVGWGLGLQVVGIDIPFRAQCWPACAGGQGTDPLFQQWCGAPPKSFRPFQKGRRGREIR